MTPCAFGASVRAGLDPDTQVGVDRSLWETVTGSTSSWFDWLLDIFPVTYIKASDLCALNLDDPVLPPVSTIASAFFRDPSSILTLYNYIRDKLRYSAFAASCVCNPSSGACDSLFGRPFSALPNSATRGAGDVDYGMSFTCINAGNLTAIGYRDWVPSSGTTRDTKLWDLTAGTQLWTQTVTVTGAGYHEVAASTVTTLIAGHNYAITMRYQSGDSINYQTSGYSGAAGSFISGISAITNHPSGTGVPTLAFAGQCVPIEPVVCAATTTPVTPTVPVQPPTLPVPPAWTCTSFGDICTRLLQVDQKLDWLIRSVPSVTSSSVAEWTVHAGLTGSGSFAVSGILGLRVLLTTIPSTYGSYGGTPVVHWGLGRVHWQTAEGWLNEVLLDVTPKEVLGIPPMVTTIGYTLASGVVATVIELTKGP